MLLLLLSLSTATAESWCAEPLYVHEWGVQVFSGEGEMRSPLGIPATYHRAGGEASGAEPVRQMPPDGGMRELPIVHFYTPGGWGDSVPLGFEVGFTQGRANAWYPQVDLYRGPEAANMAEAQEGRRTLVEARTARRAEEWNLGSASFDSDPTAQLVWDRLTLSKSPVNEAVSADVSWPTRLRELDALWVNRGPESERFLFYDAVTTERPAIAIERGDTWSPTNPHYLLRNTSDWPVHDVFLLRNPDDETSMTHVPSIPPGASAGFVLDSRPGADAARLQLRGSLVDSAHPVPSDGSWSGGECVMMRDPAIPVQNAANHRLFQAEVDAIMELWGRELFDRSGTWLVYREDTAALDALMPLSVYTDMYHYVDLRRTGLVLYKDLDLVKMSAP